MLHKSCSQKAAFSCFFGLLKPKVNKRKRLIEKQLSKSLLPQKGAWLCSSSIRHFWGQFDKDIWGKKLLQALSEQLFKTEVHFLTRKEQSERIRA